jgi:hypothetical protein
MNENDNENLPVDIKKKRGRKKKNPDANLETPEHPSITITIEESYGEEDAQVPEVVAKKRGRKPKGGKLVLKKDEKINNALPIANVILHLKCSLNDLKEHDKQINQLIIDPLTYDPTIPPNIMTYNSSREIPFSNYNDSLLKPVESTMTSIETTEENKYAYNDTNKEQHSISNQNICHSCNLKIELEESVNESTVSSKDINQKLKKIKLQLYKNTNPEKKSACFWCTYEFDNQICYIPKYEIDGELYGYGSFCRPECAVAYLMKENIDDSTKFERYHLLNQIYSKVYDYTKNIKPAPNPHYLLDKFYGNLSIQEYRKLLKSEHMLLVIEKPMTRILPELHEDNDDFVMNIYGSKQGQPSQNQTGYYKVKRQSEKQKGPSKSSIMKENFGF